VDVHPPSEPIHSWRDFFIHLITITIGLLIALSLEGVVEWFHHRHLVDQARVDMREELLGNRQSLAQNLSFVRSNEMTIGSDIKLMLSLRSGKKIGNGHASLEYTMKWSSFSNAAWKTAQSSGALIYLDFESERNLAGVYGQQDFVTANAERLARDHPLAISPLYISGNPDQVSVPEAQLILQRSADLLVDLRLLEQLLVQLDKQYAEELSKL